MVNLTRTNGPYHTDRWCISSGPSDIRDDGTYMISGKRIGPV